jgi:nucleotide-binding universal stress UspA family protein
MLFSNILLAFDGSEPSKKAADYAIRLCSLEKSSLTIIHVLDNIKQGGAIGLRARYGDVDLVEGFKKARRKNIEELIKPVEKSANDIGIKTNTVISDDESRSKLETIIDYIEKNNIDLVVVGSRGLSQFRQLLVGSIASGLISYSKCPALIIR